MEYTKNAIRQARGEKSRVKPTTLCKTANPIPKPTNSKDK